jgi:hypothetical protein
VYKLAPTKLTVTSAVAATSSGAPLRFTFSNITIP